MIESSGRKISNPVINIYWWLQPTSHRGDAFANCTMVQEGYGILTLNKIHSLNTALVVSCLVWLLRFCVVGCSSVYFG